MTKNGLRGYITLAILFAVFSVIAFVAPFSMPASFWIAYIFGVIAIALQIYVFKISFANGESAKSKFYGFPIARIGITYLVVQLVVSIVEMALASLLPLWVAIIINVLLLAAAVIGCIAADVMRDEVVRQDSQIKKDVTNMRSLQSLAASLAGQCPDESLKSDLQKLADEFKYSDPVSSDATKALETELDAQMKELQKALNERDIEGAKAYCNKLLSGLSERNRLCSLNK